jgi:hypothetical protein
MAYATPLVKGPYYLFQVDFPPNRDKRHLSKLELGPPYDIYDTNPSDTEEKRPVHRECAGKICTHTQVAFR